MLGIGPMLWRQINRELYGSASDPDPAPREEAQHVFDYAARDPRYRYSTPAAWLYYQYLDEINRRAQPQGDEGG
jgi:hypothetical protein